MKLQSEDDEYMDIPTESSINWISWFTTNESKLLSDKGYIKFDDISTFKSKGTSNPRLTIELPYIKWIAMK